MFRLGDYPLSQKLTRMNMAVSGAALVLACLGFVAYDVVSFRENIANYASTQARIVESNTASALIFEDPDAAQKTLSALASARNVLWAGIYTVDGRSFASYSRDPLFRVEPPPRLQPYPAETHWFDFGQIALVRTIFFQEKPVGYVYMRMSLQSLFERVGRYMGIAAIVLVISMGAALAVSWIFGQAVADPIKHLAEVAGTVSREKNYSLRAAATSGHDEVAVLIDAFNGMLEQIQQRDSDLQKARDFLEARVQERTAELKTLSGKLMKLQDEERRHIARELHDSTGQVVAALGMNLAVLQMDSRNFQPHAVKALEESVQIVDQLSREIRTLSHLLHPPILDEAGLESALRWYVHGFAERSGIRADLDLPENLGRLPAEVETVVFRIVQESLTNVHRHANSPTATVRVTRNAHSVRVEVGDRGRGMPADSAGGTRTSLGIGIQGMRERVAQLGGEFEVRSGPQGTVVFAVLPESSVPPSRASGTEP
jgi:signal transduction histidine kinase